MPFTPRAPFDPTADYIARKPIDCAGRSFAPGNPFPWRELGVGERSLRQLHSAFKIDVAPAATADADVPVAPPPSETARPPQKHFGKRRR